MNEGIVLGDAPEVLAQDFTPSLTGVGEEKVVAVYNPLPHDFRVVFAREQAYRPTQDENRQYAREKGLNLDKPSPKSYVTQDVILPAQKVKNLPGDIAQITVRKLVSAIIMTRNDDGSYDFTGRGGNKGMVPDPQRRMDLENEIIKGVYDATDFFNRTTVELTPQEATKQQIEALNDPTEVTADVPNPAPGTGVNYTPATRISAPAGQQDSTESAAPDPAE